nr:hypothetical protein B0A51_04993 [Rachicladosporium sp. CCFEE 5018]
MSAPLSLENVQGDILLGGLPKKNETFFLFHIDDAHVKQFCQSLKQVANEISHSSHTAAARHAIANNDSPGLVDLAGANIAFSMAGLKKASHLNIEDREPLFVNGMKAGAAGDSQSLGDPLAPGSTNQPAWESGFTSSTSIDGILLVAGSSADQVSQKMVKVKSLFGQGIVTEVLSISGVVRPGAQAGHEHFGFDDGVSQPGIAGVDDNVPPGQDTINPGVILCNRQGSKQQQPDWMTDGSFMCFRKLKQDVPGWNKFLVDASNKLGTWSDQLGARFVGRWKSGCPVALSPDFDNTNIAADPNQINNFDFDQGSNFKCPLGAHIRKTNPRSDLGPRGANSFVSTTRILRRGIPYGQELSEDPNGERGLLFVCYQSSISAGFAFLQRTWANNANFPQSGVGLDAILGQTSSSGDINMTGLFPQDPSRPLAMAGINPFVVPRGGEYAFVPSMSALTGVLSDVK